VNFDETKFLVRFKEQRSCNQGTLLSI